MWNSHNSLCTFEMAGLEITMFLLLQSWDGRHLLPPKHRTTKLHAEPFLEQFLKHTFLERSDVAKRHLLTGE